MKHFTHGRWIATMGKNMHETQEMALKANINKYGWEPAQLHKSLQQQRQEQGINV